MANINFPDLGPGLSNPPGAVFTWQAAYRVKLGGGVNPPSTGNWDSATQLCCANAQHLLLGVPLSQCTTTSGVQTNTAVLLD